MSPEPVSSRTSSRPRILLLVSGERADMLEAARRLESPIAALADVRMLEFQGCEDLSQVEFDLALVMGGDGSILRAAHLMGRRQRPVLGVNLGKVGFLADVFPDELLEQLPAICSGRLPVVELLMLECKVERGGSLLVEQLGLNEVAILAGAPFAILDIDLYVDSEHVTTYSCDGLLISTPVGSTGHSLSSGGPILRQDLQAFVISPISAHTLTNRPVVDSAQRVYEMVVPRPHAGSCVVVDGMPLVTLEAGDRVRVERSAACFKLLAVPGHSYYRTLREKLGWGGRLRFNEANK